MDSVKSFQNSLDSIFAPHLTQNNSKKKQKPEDSLYKKLLSLINNANDDLQQLYKNIETAVKNSRIKDRLGNRIMKKANVLLAA